MFLLARDRETAVSFGIPRILYPEKSMQLAKTVAMNTLLHLMKAGMDELPGIYEGSHTLWEVAKAEREKLGREGDPDRFVPICDAEKHLRKNSKRERADGEISILFYRDYSPTGS